MTSLICVFCHVKGDFGEETPSETYLIHLVTEHKIKYDIDHVLERTVFLHEAELKKRVEMRWVPSTPNYSALVINNDAAIPKSSPGVIVDSKSTKVNLQSSKVDSQSSKSDSMSTKGDCKSSDIDLNVDSQSSKLKSSKVDFKSSNIDSQSTKVDVKSSNVDSHSTIVDLKVPNRDSKSSKVDSLSKSTKVHSKVAVVDLRFTRVDSESNSESADEDPKSTNMDSQSTTVQSTSSKVDLKSTNVDFVSNEEDSSKFNEEDSESNEEDSKSMDEDSKSMDEDSKSMDEDSKSTDEDSKSSKENGNSAASLDEDQDIPDNFSDESSIHNYSNVEDKDAQKGNSKKSIVIPIKKFIPWYSGCEYRCRYAECSVVFYYSEDLRKHIKSCHGSADEYLDRFERFESKSVMIKCKECGQMIKRHFSSVKNHLINQHSRMSMQKYARKHGMKTYKIDPNPVKGNKRKRKINLIPEKKRKIDTIPVKRNKVKVGNAEYFSKWANSCKYECKMCKMTFTCYQTSYAHIKYKHSMSIAEYKRRLGPLRIETVCHRCHICGNSMIQEKTLLAQHLRAHKGMTPKKYFLQYVKTGIIQDSIPGNMKNFYMECMVCDLPFENFEKVTNHLEKKHGLVRPQSTKVKIDDNELEKFKNLCEFKCKECMSLHNQDGILDSHIKTSHGMTREEYTKKHGPLLSNAIQHCCLLCNKTIQHAWTSLKPHIYNRHKSDLRSYFSNYVAAKNLDHICNDNLDFKQYLDCTEYRCQICTRLHLTQTTLWEHLRLEHNMEPEKYMEKHGTFVTSRVDYECNICQDGMKLNKQKFQQHLDTRHNMSLPVYQDMQMADVIAHIDI